MGWDDDKKDDYFNQYSFKSTNGHNVDVFGRDRKGNTHSIQYDNISNSGSSSNTGSSSFGVGTASGIGSLILFIGVIYIFSEIVKFIQANWIYIVTVLAICIACVIVCIIIHYKARNSGLKKFFAILTSIGLIGAFFYFDPVVYGRFSLDKLLNRITIETPKIIPATTYAYVIPDALNVRSGPSAENRIIGSLVKDTRVEVIDNSEQWWLIKLEGVDGYVYSEYLRNE